MDFVLDVSIALSWCFVDEASPLTQTLLEKLETETAWVPSIWPLEIGNILISAERRKRINYADMIQFLELLSHLSIKIDADTSSKAFHDILLLAHSQKITTYDASYLELALRHGIGLASKDLALCRAAAHLGVEVLQ